MTHAWRTNSTLETIASELRDAKSVVLLTHEKPDGDAVGSSLALARSLDKIGVNATPVFVGAWSARFDSIVGSTRALMLGDEPDLAALPADPSHIVITDTGAWSQLAKLRDWLEPQRGKTIVIDHHLHGDEAVATRLHIDTGVGAVCQTIAELCRLLLRVDRVSELPAEIAEPLYLGLATDTGWFRHSNVTPDGFRLAAELLEAGADHAKLHRLTEQTDRPARLRVIGRALSSLQMLGDDAIAIISLTFNDLKASDATLDDAGGLTDMLLTAAPVRAAASVTEVGVNRVKISLRSKTGVGEAPTIDVNQVARKLGGGGHAQAAGVRLDLPIDQARDRVAQALLDAIR